MNANRLLVLLRKGGAMDEGLEMSADNTSNILTIFLQVVLAILIPFMMIAITNKEKFNRFMEQVKQDFNDLENKYGHLKGSNVKLEYDERKVKAEEAQWLRILNALNGIENEVRNSLHLSLFVQAGEGGSAVRPELEILSGASVADNYFRLSCGAALKILPYGRHAERIPAGLERAWFSRTLEKAGLRIRRSKEGREISATADILIQDPNFLTTKNKGELSRQVKQRVNSLYEDTYMLQSRVLTQLRTHYQKNPAKGAKFFRTAERFWEASEEEQDGLLAKLLFEIDEYTMSVLKEQGIELLPEVWQRGG